MTIFALTRAVSSPFLKPSCDLSGCPQRSHPCPSQSAAAFRLLSFVSKHSKNTGMASVGINSIKYGTAGGNAMLEVNRTVGNAVEQTAPFLISMWLHAVFLDPRSAAKLGWAWLGFRAVYPAVFGKVPWMFLSTLPGYAIIGKLIWPLACMDVQSRSLLASSSRGETKHTASARTRSTPSQTACSTSSRHV